MFPQFFSIVVCFQSGPLVCYQCNNPLWSRKMILQMLVVKYVEWERSSHFCHCIYLNKMYPSLFLIFNEFFIFEICWGRCCLATKKINDSSIFITCQICIVFLASIQNPLTNVMFIMLHDANWEVCTSMTQPTSQEHICLFMFKYAWACLGARRWN